MLKAILKTIMIVTMLSTGGTGNVLANSLNLSQFQWKNRLLFLFAPNRSHPSFEQLKKSLTTQKTEAADRDLIVFEILESGSSSMNTSILDIKTAQSLREKFDPPRNEFTVILIGKDGGIKLNRQRQTRLVDVFALIDAMPMRQEEMRQKSRSGGSNTAAANQSGGVE